jgi:hypothetical protein
MWAKSAASNAASRVDQPAARVNQLPHSKRADLTFSASPVRLYQLTVADNGVVVGIMGDGAVPF